MDFSIIERLNDGELNELYDDNVIVGGCHCFSSTLGNIKFGTHLFGSTNWLCTRTPAYCGYCAMKVHVGSASLCPEWCTRNGFTLVRYANSNCTCTERGGHYQATWDTCSR